MSDNELEILRLRGEILLLEQQLSWFAESQDRWRSKYLKEHPEHDSWDYVDGVDGQ